MTRLYANAGHWWRNTASLVIGLLAGVWGIWEIWRAMQGPPEYATTGYLFGAAFIAGGIYAVRLVVRDAADRVMTFDQDPATGATVTTLWRPLRTETLEAGADGVDNWRLYVTIGRRNAKTFFVYADHRAYPRPLQFELRQGNDLAGLRTIAPDVVDEFERAISKPPAA